MAVPTITIGGTDRTTSIDLYSIRLSGSGTADSETLTFDISDPTNAITVADGATVNLTESGGALTFGGFVQVVTPVHTALGRVLRVSAISKGILLDRLLVPSLTRSAGESDYTRIVYLLSTYGTGLSSTYTSIATINASMPAQTFADMTLRSALESVAALASSSAKFYVDATGKLHYYSSVPTAAPYAIKVGTPGAGEVAPEDLEVERDSTGIVNAYYVQGANDLGSGWVTDATSIATYGRRESYLTAPDADTSAKRDSYGAAALTLTKDPIARGTFTVSSPYDGWAQEQTVTVTSTQDGLSAATFVIQKVNRTYKAPSGDRTYTVEFGGALPRFTSANPPPASIPGRLITPGSLSITPFASNIRPVAIVSSLPTLPDAAYPVGAFVYNTGDTPDTLYKTSDGTNWIKAVGPGDIQADSITAGQIAAGAISTSELDAGAVTAAKIAAGAITAEKLSVGVNRNLVANGSFEEFFGTSLVDMATDGAIAAALPGWRAVTHPTGSEVLVGTSGGKAGTNQLWLKMGSPASTVAAYTNFIRVEPSRSYSGRYYIRGNALNSGVANGLVYAYWYDSSYGFISSSAIAAVYDVGAVTTWVEKTGVVTAPSSAVFVNLVPYAANTTASGNLIGFDVVEFAEAADYVRNSTADVLIDSSGITVTNGAITVTNAGSTVIIDGSSDMFKIVATGTTSATAGNTTTVSLSGLGTQSTMLAFLGFVSPFNSSTLRRHAVRSDFAEGTYNTLYAASTSGGTVNKAFNNFSGAHFAGAINSGTNYQEIDLVNTDSASTYYGRYYILKEVAI